MQADVVHRGEGTVFIGDADRFAAAGKFFGFVGGWKLDVYKRQGLSKLKSFSSTRPDFPARKTVWGESVFR